MVSEADHTTRAPKAKSPTQAASTPICTVERQLPLAELMERLTRLRLPWARVVELAGIDAPPYRTELLPAEDESSGAL